jgi:hypothetical protein
MGVARWLEGDVSMCFHDHSTDSSVHEQRS